MFIVQHSAWRSHWAAVGPGQPTPQWMQVVSRATDVTATSAAADAHGSGGGGQATAADDDVVGVSRGQDRIPADAGHKVALPTSAAVVVS